MKKNLIYICISLILISCGKESKSFDSNITFDKDIQKKVEKRIAKSEIFSDMANGFAIYDNTVILDYFENDSLVTYIQTNKKIPFASGFYNDNDTLTIDGIFGVLAGFGFSIKIKDNKATVFHLLESLDSPKYSLSKNDSLQYRLEVPCLNTNITLSKIPELKEGETIYGKVEFESDTYYQNNSTKKLRMNMTVFFKSMYFNKR